MLICCTRSGGSSCTAWSTSAWRPGTVASSSSRTPGIEASASNCSASVTPSAAIWLAASTDSAVAPARPNSGRSSEISRCPPKPENPAASLVVASPFPGPVTSLPPCSDLRPRRAGVERPRRVGLTPSLLVLGPRANRATVLAAFSVLLAGDLRASLVRRTPRHPESVLTRIDRLLHFRPDRRRSALRAASTSGRASSSDTPKLLRYRAQAAGGRGQRDHLLGGRDPRLLHALDVFVRPARNVTQRRICHHSLPSRRAHGLTRSPDPVPELTPERGPAWHVSGAGRLGGRRSGPHAIYVERVAASRSSACRASAMAPSPLHPERRRDAVRRSDAGPPDGRRQWHLIPARSVWE